LHQRKDKDKAQQADEEDDGCQNVIEHEFDYALGFHA